MERSIAIAGGGIAGLAVALALQEKADHIRIFEQAPAFSEVGAGLQLGPNAMRALRTIGAHGEVASVASSPPEIHMRDGVSGHLLRRIKLGNAFVDRFGSPYLVAHRADLHSALLGLAEKKSTIEIVNNCEVVKAETIVNGVRVILAHGNDQSHDMILAADGINSRLRRQMFDGSDAQSLPLAAHRSLLAVVPSIHGVAMDCVNLWMTPWGHVVHYPVGRSRRLNIVAVTKGEGVKSAFSRGAPALQSLLHATDQWLQWPVAHVPALPHWSIGNICLIGDAAHGTVPFLAQGAAMALEDAAALKNAIGLPKPFEALEQSRKQRVSRLDRQSRDMTRIYHAGFATRHLRNVALKSAPENVINRQLDWVYDG